MQPTWGRFHVYQIYTVNYIHVFYRVWRKEQLMEETLIVIYYIYTTHIWNHFFLNQLEKKDKN